jgi:tartrate dehydrogenase/decarboxylase/D-malate dehydrogenase
MAVNTKTYHIASIPGDGIGVEVTEQAIRVLKRIEELFGTFTLQFQHFDWSSEKYRQTGEYLPAGGLEALKSYDAILFGAVGSPGKTPHNFHSHSYGKSRRSLI